MCRFRYGDIGRKAAIQIFIHRFVIKKWKNFHTPSYWTKQNKKKFSHNKLLSEETFQEPPTKKKKRKFFLLIFFLTQYIQSYLVQSHDFNEVSLLQLHHSTPSIFSNKDPTYWKYKSINDTIQTRKWWKSWKMSIHTQYFCILFPVPCS